MQTSGDEGLKWFVPEVGSSKHEVCTHLKGVLKHEGNANDTYAIEPLMVNFSQRWVEVLSFSSRPSCTCRSSSRLLSVLKSPDTTTQACGSLLISPVRRRAYFTSYACIAVGNPACNHYTINTDNIPHSVFPSRCLQQALLHQHALWHCGRASAPRYNDNPRLQREASLARSRCFVR